MHAVARELNFEVFEVFPGMGRRGAKDLERYVGDVGRNHVVLGGSPRKGGAAGGAAGGNVAAMFKRLQAKVEAGPDASRPALGTKGKGKERVDDEVQDKGPTQSLILVDEVDVLFKGEEDFWQGASSGPLLPRTDLFLDANTAHDPCAQASSRSPSSRAARSS